MTKTSYIFFAYLPDVVLMLDKSTDPSKTRFERNFFVSFFSFFSFMPQRIGCVGSVFFSDSGKKMYVCFAVVGILGSGYGMCINSACQGISERLRQ